MPHWRDWNPELSPEQCVKIESEIESNSQEWWPEGSYCLVRSDGGLVVTCFSVPVVCPSEEMLFKFVEE